MYENTRMFFGAHGLVLPRLDYCGPGDRDRSIFESLTSPYASPHAPMTVCLLTDRLVVQSVCHNFPKKASGKIGVHALIGALVAP